MNVTSPGSLSRFISCKIFVPVRSVSTTWWNSLQTHEDIIITAININHDPVLCTSDWQKRLYSWLYPDRCSVPQTDRNISTHDSILTSAVYLRLRTYLGLCSHSDPTWNVKPQTSGVTSHVVGATQIKDPIKCVSTKPEMQSLRQHCTAVLVSRPLKTKILRYGSWDLWSCSWRIDLGYFETKQ